MDVWSILSRGKTLGNVRPKKKKKSCKDEMKLVLGGMGFKKARRTHMILQYIEERHVVTNLGDMYKVGITGWAGLGMGVAYEVGIEVGVACEVMM